MTSPAATEQRTAEPSDGEPALGLRANWRQFALLVTVNVFVGGMIGLERTVLPVVGTDEFGLEPNVVLFSFIAGVVASLVSLAAAVQAAAALTLFSGAVAWRTMNETAPSRLAEGEAHG